jgi:agmatine deiminase
LNAIEIETLFAALLAFMSPMHQGIRGEESQVDAVSAYASGPEGNCCLTDDVRRLLELPDDVYEAPFEVYDEYRALRPQIYGVTKRPSSPLRMAGDYEVSQSLLLAYKYYEEYESIFGDLIEAAVDEGEVRILVNRADSRRLINLLRRRRIPRRNVIIDERIPFDTVWIRDWGPQVVIGRNGLEVIDAQYFYNCLLDDAAPSRMAPSLGIERTHRAPLYIEGGNLLSNGQGLCFSTTSIIGHNNNDEEAVSVNLRDYYGCDQIIFLEPLVGNAVPHVDMFMSFASEDLVLLGQYTPRQDSLNYTVLEENAYILSNVQTRSGRRLNIIRVPMPDLRPDTGDEEEGPLIRSYLNLLPFNGVVFVPIYLDERSHERRALAAIQRAFPERTIVPIAVDEMALDNGTIHCITQTVPAYIR